MNNNKLFIASALSMIVAQSTYSSNHAQDAKSQERVSSTAGVNAWHPDKLDNFIGDMPSTAMGFMHAHGANASNVSPHLKGPSDEGRKLQKEIWEEEFKRALENLGQDKNNKDKIETACNILKKKYFFDQNQDNAQTGLMQILSIVGNCNDEAIGSINVLFEHTDTPERINMLKKEWEQDLQQARDVVRKTVVARREIIDLCDLINQNDKIEGVEEQVLQVAYQAIQSHLKHIADYNLEINNIGNRYKISSFINCLRTKRLQFLRDAQNKISFDKRAEIEECVEKNMDNIVFADEIEQLIAYQDSILRCELGLKNRIKDIGFTLAIRFDAQARNLWERGIKDLAQNSRIMCNLLDNMQGELECIGIKDLSDNDKIKAYNTAKNNHEQINALNQKIMTLYPVRNIAAKSGTSWYDMSEEVDHVILLKLRITWAVKSAQKVMDKLDACMQTINNSQREALRQSAIKMATESEDEKAG